MPVAHEQQRADHGPHLVVAEGVGAYLDLDDAVQPPAHPEVEDLANRRRALALLRVRGEVMFPHKGLGGGVHREDIQLPVVPEHMVAQQRIHTTGPITDPVHVTPPQSSKPSIEPNRRLGNTPHPHIFAEPPGKPLEQLLLVLAPQLSGQIDVGDLPSRMHPGIGTPGHCQFVRGLPDRVTVRRASSISPCTVRRPPACLAHPENAVPS